MTMRKIAIIAFAILIPAAASADKATLTVTDYDAANIIAALEAGGVKMTTPKDKKAIVAVQKLHCDTISNAPLDGDDPQAGIPQQHCSAVHDGKRLDLRETQWLLTSLQKVGIEPDCAMSQCTVDVATLSCVIDTSVDSFTGKKRWLCTMPAPPKE